ncbi:hypothetical protein IV203_033234 [Nitzschia inconspicua]|uniref:Uncharacterized protein n=1 Tax=Nitzschia inconspicua TaxID=303405 RepID=A0A9K3PFQ9_9STRA|nr:hypothetical protein IV203_033234 [Nitzschia inconspicua]
MVGGPSPRSSMHKNAFGNSSHHTLASSSHHRSISSSVPSNKTRWIYNKTNFPSLCVLALFMVCIANIEYQAFMDSVSRDSELETSLYYYSGLPSLKQKEEQRLRIGMEANFEPETFVESDKIYRRFINGIVSHVLSHGFDATTD